VHNANNFDCEVHESDCMRETGYGTKDRQYGCEHVFDNDALADFGEWSTASECGGWVQVRRVSDKWLRMTSVKVGLE